MTLHPGQACVPSMTPSQLWFVCVSMHFNRRVYFSLQKVYLEVSMIKEYPFFIIFPFLSRQALSPELFSWNKTLQDLFYLTHLGCIHSFCLYFTSNLVFFVSLFSCLSSRHRKLKELNSVSSFILLCLSFVTSLPQGILWKSWWG